MDIDVIVASNQGGGDADINITSLSQNSPYGGLGSLVGSSASSTNSFLSPSSMTGSTNGSVTDDATTCFSGPASLSSSAYSPQLQNSSFTASGPLNSNMSSSDMPKHPKRGKSKPYNNTGNNHTSNKSSMESMMFGWKLQKTAPSTNLNYSEELRKHSMMVDDPLNTAQPPRGSLPLHQQQQPGHPHILKDLPPANNLPPNFSTPLHNSFNDGSNFHRFRHPPVVQPTSYLPPPSFAASPGLSPCSPNMDSPLYFYQNGYPVADMNRGYYPEYCHTGPEPVPYGYHQQVQFPVLSQPAYNGYADPLGGHSPSLSHFPSSLTIQSPLGTASSSPRTPTLTGFGTPASPASPVLGSHAGLPGSNGPSAFQVVSPKNPLHSSSSNISPSSSQSDLADTDSTGEGSKSKSKKKKR